MRTRGVGDLTEVKLLVIERSGDISLIKADEPVTPGALTGLRDRESVRSELDRAG